jgi:PucR family transcriptional regulator, purine catabolism regulatory protein
MAMKLRHLLAAPNLGLVIRCTGSEDGLEAVVHWVHQSELSDSTLFTEPGEVLLTTASHLPDPASTDTTELAELCDAYVRRLRDSRVVGLGLGVGVHHATSPRELIAAAEHHGLPLFEIPYEVPFSALIKAISKSLSDAEHAYLRRTNSAQRRLITAVGRAQVPQSVVRSTGQIIGGWAALTDPSGRVTVLSPTAKAAAAQAASASHLSSGQQVSFPGSDAGRVCAHSVMAGDGKLLAVLITGAEAELDPLAISTSMLAANLVGIHLSLSGQLERALDSLRAPLMSEVLEGKPDLARQLVGTLWPKLPAEPLRLSCVDGPASELSQVVFREIPALWGLVAGRLWVVTSADHTAALAEVVSKRRQLSVGTSEPTKWGELGRAKHQALNSLLATRTSRGEVDLLELLPPDQARTFAHARLGTLLEPEHSDLLQTVRAWADQGGSFDQTATALGVHRHTIRRRMLRVAEYLGVELTDPRQRHELWFACQVVDRLGLDGLAAASSVA